VALSEKDVQYVAKLARLEVTDQETAKYTQQLGNILQYR
jgi:aspartyl/glutamyl-tRNA(Asn/Gln) amidotransferase C subunit